MKQAGGNHPTLLISFLGANFIERQHEVSALGRRARLVRYHAHHYDANGNMITRIAGGSTYNLTYDAENRLTGVSGGASATFVYDGVTSRATIHHRFAGMIHQTFAATMRHRFAATMHHNGCAKRNILLAISVNEKARRPNENKESKPDGHPRNTSPNASPEQ
jgi:YD repeat-containing protein